MCLTYPTWTKSHTIKILHHNQARRYGGAFRGRYPQMTACDPQAKIVSHPKRGLCPEEINRLGAIGLQIEA